MYYRIPLDALPEVRECHIHTRKTIWNCTHRRNTLVYIRQGYCQFKINEKTVTMSPGKILFIPANQEYTRFPVNNAPCTLVYLYFKTTSPVISVASTDISLYLGRFDDEIANNILYPSVDFQELEKEIFISDYIDSAEHSDELFDIFNDIVTQLYTNQRYSYLYSSAKFLEILSIIGQISISDYSQNILSTHNHYPAPLEKAIVYITKNYNQKITMDDLCKYSNISPQHLIRLFHTHMHTTPIQYINQNKISHAKEMLRTTGLSISEISYSLGFSDPGYFSRLFKKIEKRSPNQVRAYIQNYDKKNTKNEEE